jgi:hypothetical protein
MQRTAMLLQLISKDVALLWPALAALLQLQLESRLTVPRDFEALSQTVRN